MKNIEITDIREIEAIIKKTRVCHVGMVDGEHPYVLPYNFGYKDKTVYLHSGPGGRKHDILQKNNRVCIAFDIDGELNIRNENVACSYSMKFRSVIITGKVEIMEDYDEKINGMNIIMRQYVDRDFEYNAPAINNVVIMRVKAEKITARKRGYE